MGKKITNVKLVTIGSHTPHIKEEEIKKNKMR
jgi:hypothetical protein